MPTPDIPNQPIVIYGAGGHGQVVADAAAAMGLRVLGFMDDAVTADRVGAWRVVDESALAGTDAYMIVAVGDNFARRRIMRDMSEAGRRIVNVIHPSAAVSPSALLGRGVFVGPGAIINADARVGDGAIINSGAIVEHHCRVGDFAHIAPGATLGGGAAVGDLSLIGLGAVLLPRVTVENDCIIGAGGVVTSDVPRGSTAVGVPAKVRVTAH